MEGIDPAEGNRRPRRESERWFCPSFECLARSLHPEPAASGPRSLRRNVRRNKASVCSARAKKSKSVLARWCQRASSAVPPPKRRWSASTHPDKTATAVSTASAGPGWSASLAGRSNRPVIFSAAQFDLGICAKRCAGRRPADGEGAYRTASSIAFGWKHATMTRMAFDEDLARAFAHERDRDVAPFFAGRAAEIASFERALRFARRHPGAPAEFRVYQGAPRGRQVGVAAPLPSGRETVFKSRVGWALTHLKHAGLVKRVGHGLYRRTPDGKRLADNRRLRSLDMRRLQEIPAYTEWKESFAAVAEPRGTTNAKRAWKAASPDDVTPEELLEDAAEELRVQLESELLTRVQESDPTLLESVVVELLNKMGYDGGDAQVTGGRVTEVSTVWCGKMHSVLGGCTYKPRDMVKATTLAETSFRTSPAH